MRGAEIVRHPDVLQALSPHWAVRFFVDEPLIAFLALGGVVLAITGAEALYADMGHFGRRPISRAWLAVVFPALTLNYLGQGALLVDDESARRATRSSCWCPTGRRCRWWRWPRWPR